MINAARTNSPPGPPTVGVLANINSACMGDQEALKMLAVRKQKFDFELRACRADNKNVSIAFNSRW